MQFSVYNQMDARNHQSNEAQKDRDFKASENALDRALSQSLSASRGGGGGGGSVSSKDNSYDMTINELQAYYESKGIDPLKARQYAKQYASTGVDPLAKNKTQKPNLVQFKNGKPVVVNKQPSPPVNSVFSGMNNVSPPRKKSFFEQTGGELLTSMKKRLFG